jgi:hypothetical protein
MAELAWWGATHYLAFALGGTLGFFLMALLVAGREYAAGHTRARGRGPLKVVR